MIEQRFPSSGNGWLALNAVPTGRRARVQALPYRQLPRIGILVKPLIRNCPESSVFCCILWWALLIFGRRAAAKSGLVPG